MSESVSQAEAGLVAAPWAGAAQDATLEQAAKTFYALTADLTQHGKKDHPTDRIVLDDTAAMLALELGAEPASSRAASLSEYIKLPGSGDGFTITVHADGQADFKRRAHGPDGVDTAPGAEAVMAQYAAVIGHAPSQDELAGFLAARVAGGALAFGATVAGVAGAAAASAATAVLMVTGADGAVLAMGTAAQLLAKWSLLVALNNAVTPNIELPGQPPLLNATASAACLLGLAMQAGTVSAGLVQSYNATVSWLDKIDQPMLAVAAHYAALAKADAAAGATGRVTLDQTAAQLALAIATEPEGARGSQSQAVHVDGHETKVTVSQTTTDLTGGAQFHDLANTNILSLVEQVGTAILDVAAVVVPVLAPAAVAVNVAEAGQGFAEGNVLGGVLSLGSAVGLGLAAAQASQASQLTFEGTALVGGVSGAVQSAQGGDGLGIAAGLLEAGSAVAGSLVSSGQVSSGAAGGLATGVAVGTGLASAGLSSSEAFLHGDLAGGLGDGLGAVLGEAATLDRQQAATGDSDAPTAGAAGSSVLPVQQQGLPPPDAPDAGAGAQSDLPQGGPQQDSAQQHMKAGGQRDPDPAIAPQDADAILAGMARGAAATQGGVQFAQATGITATDAVPGGDTDATTLPEVSTTAFGASPDDPLQGGTLHYTLPDERGPRTAVIAGQSPEGGYWLQGGGYVGQAWVMQVDRPPGQATPAPVADDATVNLGPLTLDGTASQPVAGLGTQAGQFVTGVGEGLWDGAKSMVQGVGALAKDGYDLATSTDARQQAWDAAVQDAQAVGEFAETAVTDPGKATGQVGDAVSGAWNQVATAYQEAAAAGHGTEFIGKAFGQGTVLAGTALVPGGAEAETVGALGDAGRVAEVTADAGKAVGAVEDTASAADDVAENAGGAQGALNGSATGTVPPVTSDPPVAGLRGTDYEIPGWHTEEIAYTKRSPEDLAALRSEFDGGVRRGFLEDLGTNHADALRAAGMDHAQITRVASGRVPQGYQVHHYLPLDDGGTNAYDNLVLIRNDPDHMLVTNYQNAATRGLQAGQTRQVEWLMPDTPTHVWPDVPGRGAMPVHGR